MVKNPPINAGDIREAGSIPGSGGSPGEGNGHPLHHSCLGNPMDRGAWRTTVHGVAKRQMQATEHAYKITMLNETAILISHYYSIYKYGKNMSVFIKTWVLSSVQTCRNTLLYIHVVSKEEKC